MKLSQSSQWNLRPAILGLTLAIITILFGQGMGVVFGVNEDAIKSTLEESARAVKETVYKNDDIAMKAVLTKCWSYMQRAHLHAGAMGTTAVTLIILLCLIECSPLKTLLISIGLGAGGLGYSLFWMLAGFRAPVLGSTGIAKESLKWLAQPSVIMFISSTFFVLALMICKVFKSSK